MERLFSCAVHEAAHAVASWHLLAKPLGCRLFVEGDTWGGIATDLPTEEATPTYSSDPLPDQAWLVAGIDQAGLFREAVTDAAGYASQIELLNESTPRTRREEKTPDLLRIKAALLAVAPDATESDFLYWEELVFSMARRFCRKHSGHILLIAAQLHEKRSFSQTDVLRLIYPRVNIIGD